MKHIPNILSFFRIALIPFFIWQMLNGDYRVAAVILLISGITDLLDGFLARKFNWISQLGKVLDPIADKLTQVTVCIVLAFRLKDYAAFFVILLVKEFLMLVFGGYLIKKGAKLEGAKWFGKIVTFLFYSTTISLVFIPEMPGWLISTLLGITTFCAVAAALMYIPEFIKYRKEVMNKINQQDFTQ